MSKFKSLKGRWFSQKGGNGIVEGDKDGDWYIQRDSLIKVRCKRGEIISVENYRVLGFLRNTRTSGLFQLRRGFL